MQLFSVLWALGLRLCPSLFVQELVLRSPSVLPPMFQGHPYPTRAIAQLNAAPQALYITVRTSLCRLGRRSRCVRHAVVIAISSGFDFTPIAPYSLAGYANGSF